MTRLRLVAALLLPCLLLGGCTPAVPQRGRPYVPMPPPSPAGEAPLGDLSGDLPQNVFLSLKDRGSGLLRYHGERILVPATRHPAEAALRKLFSFQQTDSLSAPGGDVRLSLMSGSGVEISGSVACVNLSVDALLLNRQDFFVASQAIANTLTQWEDIRYVNVLVAGMQRGVDTAATLPAGCLTRAGSEEMRLLWESLSGMAAAAGDAPETARFSAVAALYFPVAAGRGILAEARVVSFPGQTQAQMAGALLAALADGARTLPAAPAVPNLPALLAEEPRLEERPSAGGRVLRLRFSSELNEALIAAGIPRSVMLASLTVTLSTFLPGCAGLEVTIGEERVASVVPSGIYEAAGEEIPFYGGVMKRQDFSAFILNHCALYFSDQRGGLVRVLRPVPHGRTRQIRFLVRQLLEGPQSADSITGLLPSLPPDLGDADLLGTAREGDAVLLNFSRALPDASRGLSLRDEQLMVYSLVNTLTEIPAVSRVRLFVEGGQPETLGGALYVAGDFLRNPGIVRAP